MKITIDAKEFERLVSVASQAIPSKPIRPEYECVYVEASIGDGGPVMTAMGRDAGIAIKRSTDSVEIREEGVALIPANTLGSYLKIMDGPVKMDVNESRVCTLKCGGKKASISCLDASDFNADFQRLSNWNVAAMDGKEFASAVGDVSHCINEQQDVGRIVLTGVCFAFDGSSGHCEAVGTDGLKFAMTRKKAETDDTFKALIPIGYAKLISKIVGNSEKVNFRFGNGVVIAEDGISSIEASQLSGEYIDYRRVATKDGKMQARINVEETIEALKMAQIASLESQKNLVIMNFDEEGILRISSRSDRTESATDVNCDTNGRMDGKQEIAFNAQYMLDSLRASANYSGEATLIINTPSSPMVVLPVGRDDYFQLVLPVRRL